MAAPNRHPATTRTATTWARRRLRELKEPSSAFAVGRSLAPFVALGQWARIDGRRPRAGEVAVYRAGEVMRAHRVVAASDAHLVVRGDHLGLPLEAIPMEAIIGTWVPDAPWRRPALTATAGRIIAGAGITLARPPVVRTLRALVDRVPRSRTNGARIEVAGDDPPQLAAVLSRFGLMPAMPGLDDLQDAVLGDTGFAVLARRRHHTTGALRALAAGEGLLVAIAVARRHRGHGLGRRLLAAAVEEARRRHAPRLLADVRRDNVASLRLFRRAGFTKTADAVLVAPGDGVLLDRYALDLG